MRTRSAAWRAVSDAVAVPKVILWWIVEHFTDVPSIFTKTLECLGTYDVILLNKCKTILKPIIIHTCIQDVITSRQRASVLSELPQTTKWTSFCKQWG